MNNSFKNARVSKRFSNGVAKIFRRERSVSAPRKPKTFSSARRRFLLEALEERRLLDAVAWTVNLTTDSGVPQLDGHIGDLRSCIQAASAGDTIVFDPDVFSGDATIRLNGELEPILVDKPLTIDATANRSGFGKITIDASAGTDRIFDVDANDAPITMKGLTLTGVRAVGENATRSNGGAICLTAGDLTLEDCVLTGNSVVSSEENPFGARGGAIFASGPNACCVVRNCEISRNVATTSNASPALGGGIYFNGSRLTIEHSTIFDNRVVSTAADASTSVCGGGGVYCLRSTSSQNQEFSATITDATIYGNSVESAATAISGGGIFFDFAESASYPSATDVVRAVVENSTIVNNSLSTTNTDPLYSVGGGLSVNAGADAKTTIFNSTIGANSARNANANGIQLGRALSVASSSNTTPVDVLNSVLTGTGTGGFCDVYLKDSANLSLYYSAYGNLAKSATQSTPTIVACAATQSTAATFAGWNATTNSIDLTPDDLSAKIKSSSGAATVGTLVGKLGDDFYYYGTDGGDAGWRKVGDLTGSKYAFDENAENFGLPASGIVYSTAQNGGAIRTARGGDYYAGAYSLPAEASTIVTTTVDVVDPNDGVVSLREAIRYYSASGDSIYVNDSSVSSLSLSAPIVVDQNLTIGDGTTQITLDGGATSENRTGGVRLLEIATGTTLTLKKATLQNAYSEKSGGAILNRGTLALEEVDFKNNVSTGNGGAIANLNGTLTIAKTLYTQTTLFSKNVARNGGAIYSFGDAASVSIAGLANVRAAFDANESERAGGAIAIRSGKFVANNVLFTNNTSNRNSTEYVPGSGPGGALYNEGIATVSNATFTSNTAKNADGGAISNGGTLTATGLTVGGFGIDVNGVAKKNVAEYGGGIVNSGELIFASGTNSITYNEASKNGGGIANVDDKRTGSGGKIRLSERYSVVEIMNNVATQYGGGLISVANTAVAIDSTGALKFYGNSATEHTESGDVALYSVVAWPTSQVSAPNLYDYSPVSSLISIQSDCAAIIANAANETTVYQYSFEIAGQTKTITSPTVLSPSSLGLAPGFYRGTVEATNASGETLGFGTPPITLEVQASAPTFSVESTTLGDGDVLRLNLKTTGTSVSFDDWRLSWGDGTETTSDVLSTTIVVARRYEAPGAYSVSLMVDGTTIPIATFVVGEREIESNGDESKSNATGKSREKLTEAAVSFAVEAASRSEGAFDVNSNVADVSDFVFVPISKKVPTFSEFVEQTPIEIADLRTRQNGERSRAFADQAFALEIGEGIAGQSERSEAAAFVSASQQDVEQAFEDDLFNEIFENASFDDEFETLSFRDSDFA